MCCDIISKKKLCKLTILSVIMWALSSEFVSSSIPSWQALTAHTQPFREARDLAFCLKVPLDSLLVWASSGGSGETARMRKLTWTFAARICDKYQICLTRSMWCRNLHNMTIFNMIKYRICQAKFQAQFYSRLSSVHEKDIYNILRCSSSCALVCSLTTCF